MAGTIRSLPRFRPGYDPAGGPSDRGDRDRGPYAPTLGWVLQSHFGVLATLTGCLDTDLLVKIRTILDDAGLGYIPHEYVAQTTCQLLCKALVGFSWYNRYFELRVQFNYNKLEGSSDLEG